MVVYEDNLSVTWAFLETNERWQMQASAPLKTLRRKAKMLASENSRNYSYNICIESIWKWLWLSLRLNTVYELTGK